MAGQTDWRKRLVHASQDFVLVNKPGGVPAHSSVDNATETTAYSVGKELGCALTSLHRLDVPTHGLLVLGRCPLFASHFQRLLRMRRVHKEYLALVIAPPPMGLLVGTHQWRASFSAHALVYPERFFHFHQYAVIFCVCIMSNDCLAHLVQVQYYAHTAVASGPCCFAFSLCTDFSICSVLLLWFFSSHRRFRSIKTLMSSRNGAAHLFHTDWAEFMKQVSLKHDFSKPVLYLLRRVYETG